MALKNFAFKVLNTDKYARCGLIKTHRGDIQTPTFMPVETPSPTWSTIPAKSIPGTYGGGYFFCSSALIPLRTMMSVGFTAEALFLMRISPGPAWTSGTLITLSASGPP